MNQAIPNSADLPPLAPRAEPAVRQSSKAVEFARVTKRYGPVIAERW